MPYLNFCTCLERHLAFSHPVYRSMMMNSEQQSVALLISNWLKMTTLGHNPLCLCVVVGLEFGSAVQLAPSAFLASAAASSGLAHLILPANLPANMQPPQLSYVDEALAAWSQGCQEQPPTDAAAHHQITWDLLLQIHHLQTHLIQCTGLVSLQHPVRSLVHG